mgnify:CR=1 FL=1
MNHLQAESAARKPIVAGNTDTSLLKIIALVFMIIDHVGVAFVPGVRELRVLGRIAMPLYAWCIVVGSDYTRNALKYALRLFVLAVVSQPFYVMALDNSWTHLNILFLFCLGVLAIAGIKEKRWGSQFWAPALCMVIAAVLDIDYGLTGLLFILLLYASRGSKGAIAAAYLAAAAFWGSSSFAVSSFFCLNLTVINGPVLTYIRKIFFSMQAFMWLALPLILIPMHSNIRMPKWLGYGLYPLHLAVLMIVGLLLGVPFSDYISSLGQI